MNKLFLIRHAQSEGNVDSQVYYDKHDSDILLTSKGHEQAQLCANTMLERIDKSKRVVLFNSPYARTVETAQHILDTFKDDFRDIFAQENVLLREREWGQLRDVVDSKRFSREKHFNFYYRPTNGESFADAYNRVVSFFTTLKLLRLEGTSLSNRDIIIVTHGEWIRLALMYLEGRTVQQFCEKSKNPYNCCIIERNF